MSCMLFNPPPPPMPAPGLDSDEIDLIVDRIPGNEQKKTCKAAELSSRPRSVRVAGGAETRTLSRPQTL